MILDQDVPYPSMIDKINKYGDLNTMCYIITYVWRNYIQASPDGTVFEKQSQLQKGVPYVNLYEILFDASSEFSSFQKVQSSSYYQR